MTTTQVRAHNRKLPEKRAKAQDPFNDLIEARKAILAARMKPREQWSTSGYRVPKIFSTLAEWIRQVGKK